jgi:hypothetical protein
MASQAFQFRVTVRLSGPLPNAMVTRPTCAGSSEMRAGKSEPYESDPGCRRISGSLADRTNPTARDRAQPPLKYGSAPP